jgi:hypothetical protein
MIFRLVRLFPICLFLFLLATPVSAAAPSVSLASEPIENVIGDWITYGFVIAALMFIVYMVMNLAQAQFASFMNVPRMHAVALEQAGIAVVLLAIAASARPITDKIGQILVSTGNNFTSVESLLIGLTQFALSLILGIVIAVTFLAAVWNIIRAQGDLYLGRPSGLSQAIINLIAVLLGGFAVFLSLPFSSWILNQISGLPH